MTVYENLKKLNYDLVRAEERSKHAAAVRQDMERKQRIYEENVRRVKGAQITPRRSITHSSRIASPTVLQTFR